ncbi:MAG: IgA Peptidase M64 [Bacteroidetes bacterium]|nr:IgA Peptidase M64 [Bacteroidota bacterium]
MKKYFFILLLTTYNLSAQLEFEDYFENKALRFDYLHIGNNSEETFVFDEMKLEPYFSGSFNSLIDTFYYGNHFFNVKDSQSGKLIYSRGFSSLFQEWQSTEEATKYKRAFNETIIIPFPKIQVTLEILSRDKTQQNKFVVKYTHVINPIDYFISEERGIKYNSEKINDAGNPNEKLDIVFIPEGYTETELDDFRDKAREFTDYLFSFEPFKSNTGAINIWVVMAPSIDTGTDIPRDNVWKNTIVNSSFYTFDSERYLMTTDIKTLRDIASSVPYDQIVILVNTDKYGGGAIYNYYSLTAANNPSSANVFVHEFGHGLAGLADEYGNDPTYIDYYPSGVEPWEPNITTLVDFENKWKDLISENTPIPTPDTEDYRNVIGVFEGAGYVPNGVYRSTYDSIMRSLSEKGFNIVSQRAMEKIINFYAH